MAQRGRKKSGNIVALRVDGSPPPLQPPSFLNAGERKVFRELINSVDTRHFVAADLPLLVSFVQATLMSRKTARNPKQIAAWEKSVRVMAMLATRLRISPQSRYDNRAAARQLDGPRGKRPWTGGKFLGMGGGEETDEAS
jgi:phage terminase small subunit